MGLSGQFKISFLDGWRAHAVTLSDLGIVCCKSMTAVYFLLSTTQTRQAVRASWVCYGV